MATPGSVCAVCVRGGCGRAKHPPQTRVRLVAYPARRNSRIVHYKSALSVFLGRAQRSRKARHGHTPNKRSPKATPGGLWGGRSPPSERSESIPLSPCTWCRPLVRRTLIRRRAGLRPTPRVPARGTDVLGVQTACPSCGAGCRC